MACATGDPPGRMPDFLIIGAMKCGTTTLHILLGHHPDIFTSREKELHYFSREENLARGGAWYRAHFRTDAKLCGESSPSYAAWPHFDGVAERIVATLPDVRLIYCVRDPIARAISHYKDAMTKGYAVAPPDIALTKDVFIRRGCYATQIERYLAAGMPVERIHVVQSERLAEDRAGTVAEVLRFLGVEPRKMPGLPTRDANTSRRRRVPTVTGRRIKRAIAPAINGIPWSLRTHVEATLLAPFSRPMPAISISSETRERLVKKLAPEAARLRAITGMSFPGWSV